MDALNQHSLICKVNSCPQQRLIAHSHGTFLPLHQVPTWHLLPCFSRQGGREREAADYKPAHYFTLSVLQVWWLRLQQNQTESTLCPLVATERLGNSSWLQTHIRKSHLLPALGIVAFWFFGFCSPRESVSFTCSGFHSHFSCQERGKTWGKIHVKIHAFWEMFIGVQTREPLKTKLFSLCPPSPPANSFCSYALTKLIYFHARIIFLRASGLPSPRETVRKSRDFHHKAGLCSRQSCGRKSLFGSWLVLSLGSRRVLLNLQLVK